VEPIVALAVLAAALAHASWNALVKVGGDPLVRLTVVIAGTALCSVPLAVAAPIPAPASWPWLALSAAVHQLYFLFLVLGYRAGDLGTVYPIARGAAPVLVAAGALVFAGERLDLLGVAAVGLVASGVASLAFATARSAARGRAVTYALLTAVTIGAYSVADGLGSRRSGSVAGYVAWLFVLQSVPLLGATVLLRGRELGAALRDNYRQGAGGGVLAFAGYGLVVWAMSRAPMSYVAALREVSVVLAAWLGSRVLGEPFGARRLVSAAVVAIGLALLQLARAS
jgi:drug/metabolite transporter (DMT)-like permease